MKHILLVEDNKKLSDLISEYLLQHNFKVSVEYNGDNAVNKILQEKPDLIILDVMLPGLSGFEICRTVRQDYDGCIMILTARDSNYDHIEGLNLGADDFITKPIDPEVLLARIHTRLRNSVKGAQAILQFGNLKINPTTQMVQLKNEECILKPSEFELLYVLATHHDKILNRNDITQLIKGMDYNGVDRSIDLRISYLRKKLEDDISNPYKIKTIRGKGYVFISEAWNNEK